MAKKHEKGQKQPVTPHPTTPAKPVELNDKELRQVVGGWGTGGGAGKITPDPTAVE